jgi:superfamily II DNA or RNA helicase
MTTIKIQSNPNKELLEINDYVLKKFIKESLLYFVQIPEEVIFSKKVIYKSGISTSGKFWEYWKRDKNLIKGYGFVVSKSNEDNRFYIFFKDIILDSDIREEYKEVDIYKSDFYKKLNNDKEKEIVSPWSIIDDSTSINNKIEIDNESTILKNTSILYDWQQNPVKHVLQVLQKNKSVLDASETGTGKTVIALGVMRELEFPFIVVCPKVVITSWKRWCKEFNLNPLLITNYEQIKLGKTEFYKIQYTNTEKNLKFDRKWIVPENTVIIFDEAHKTKNYQTGNSKLLQDASKQDIYTYLLSATIGENPLKLRAAGETLRLFLNYAKWAAARGVWGTEFLNTEKNINNIHKDIFGTNKGLRVGRDILESKLPMEKIEVIYHKFDNSNKIKKEYDELQSKVLDLQNVKSYKEKSGAMLAARMKARQAIELYKIPDIVELTENAIEEGNSVVIFVNFSDTIDELSKRLKTKCIVDGKHNNRQESIDDFNSGKSKIILVNIKSGGVGLSLHDTIGNAPRISYINPCDSAQDLKQALGRIFRVGGKSRVIQNLLFAEETIEESIGKNVKDKINNINGINDGDLAESFLKGYFNTSSVVTN